MLVSQMCLMAYQRQDGAPRGSNVGLLQGTFTDLRYCSNSMRGEKALLGRGRTSGDFHHWILSSISDQTHTLDSHLGTDVPVAARQLRTVPSIRYIALVIYST